jgi:hypothetical protein
MSMLETHIGEIAGLLREQSVLHSGVLPELYRIAWHAYLTSGVIDHVDYDQVRDYFPDFTDDPDKNDPVNAIAIGKHYFDPDPTIPEGGFLEETTFQGKQRKINEDKKHLGGELTPGFAVAWSGKLLGLHDCKEITDSEYEQLKAMLPEVEDNPVKEVEAFTRRYIQQ